jgi:hypothetical protein
MAVRGGAATLMVIPAASLVAGAGPPRPMPRPLGTAVGLHDGRTSTHQIGTGNGRAGLAKR